MIPAQTKPNVVWQAQPGSQWFFIHCPVWEVLYEGTRGPGKTDALLMDFLQHVGQGYGKAWRGVLFREEFPQLEDVITKSKKWFPRIFPNARLIEGQKLKWVFPEGEELLFRAARRESDYFKFHGHEYPWVGWEELTNWQSSGLYERMKTVNRSSMPGMPRKYRATANPYGPGHDWVKSHFVDFGPPGTIAQDGEGRTRTRIHGVIWENRFLLENDPDYVKTLMGLKDPNLRLAWFEGSWDIVSGGYFAPVWDVNKHYLDPFAIPPTWKWRASFDWGSSAPASLGIWAIADGTQPQVSGRNLPVFPKNSAIRVDELYTVEKDANGVSIPNKGKGQSNTKLGAWIAQKLKYWESMGAKFTGNVADPSIFTEGGGESDYEQMQKGARDDEDYYLSFDRADNERRPGWKRVFTMLENSAEDRPEKPGLWVFTNCRDWKRTVPMLQRDEKDLDDVDTTQEDHPADETRYFVQSLGRKTISTAEVEGF